MQVLACLLVMAASVLLARGIAHADAPIEPLDPDATQDQQYYLYGADCGGANVIAAWELLASKGVDAKTKVDVAVLDTGIFDNMFIGDAGWGGSRNE